MTVFFRRRSSEYKRLIGAVYGDLGKYNFTATLYVCDRKTGNKLYPIDVTGRVYFYIFTEDTGGSGWSYYSKNFTPVKCGIMTKQEGETGVYKATYTKLSSGSYVMFAIAEDYTVLD